MEMDFGLGRMGVKVIWRLNDAELARKSKLFKIEAGTCVIENATWAL